MIGRQKVEIGSKQGICQNQLSGNFANVEIRQQRISSAAVAALMPIRKTVCQFTGANATGIGNVLLMPYWKRMMICAGVSLNSRLIKFFSAAVISSKILPGLMRSKSEK